jgi:hypothetical protein
VARGDGQVIYVDNARIPATIGRLKARWSHLTADTPEELYAFAEKLFLKREWFQAHCKSDPRCPRIDKEKNICIHFHYDVTDRVRGVALQEGAKSIDLRHMGWIIMARRDMCTTFLPQRPPNR